MLSTGARGCTVHGVIARKVLHVLALMLIVGTLSGWVRWDRAQDRLDFCQGFGIGKWSTKEWTWSGVAKVFDGVVATMSDCAWTIPGGVGSVAAEASAGASGGASLLL